MSICQHSNKTVIHCSTIQQFTQKGEWLKATTHLNTRTHTLQLQMSKVSKVQQIKTRYFILKQKTQARQPYIFQRLRCAISDVQFHSFKRKQLKHPNKDMVRSYVRMYTFREHIIINISKQTGNTNNIQKFNTTKFQNITNTHHAKTHVC